MLNLDDIKDRMTEMFNTVKDAIEESSYYNNLREKFEILPAKTQRGLILGSLIFFLIILLSIPFSFLSSSRNFVSEFEEHRGLIRALLRTRSLASGPPLPQGLDSSEMESKAKASLSQAGLLETQIGQMESLPEGDPENTLAPKNVQQQGLKVQVKKLNLRQVIDLGYQLQNLDSSVKMTGLEIAASSEDPHYFDTVFKLISYSLPQPEKKPESEGPRPRNRGGK